jgi:hypothetical protein
MDSLTCNEFKKQFEAVFGKCEFYAESGDIKKQSAGWISDEALKQMPDSIVHYREAPSEPAKKLKLSGRN